MTLLRVGLPPAIQITSVRPVNAEFHARFSATGKIYAYHLHLGDADPFTRPYVWVLDRPRPPDFVAMESVAAVLRGRHDFAAFSAFNGDGFLYKMVRSLTGALVAAGEGKLDAKRTRALLEGGRRLAEVQTSPPQGLFLVRVLY